MLPLIRKPGNIFPSIAHSTDKMSRPKVSQQTFKSYLYSYLVQLEGGQSVDAGVGPLAREGSLSLKVGHGSQLVEFSLKLDNEFPRPSLGFSNICHKTRKILFIYLHPDSIFTAIFNPNRYLLQVS